MLYWPSPTQSSLKRYIYIYIHDKSDNLKKTETMFYKDTKDVIIENNYELSKLYNEIIQNFKKNVCIVRAHAFTLA